MRWPTQGSAGVGTRRSFILLTAALIGVSIAAEAASTRWSPKEGDFAVYEISGLPAGFDDGGEGAPAIIRYRWQVEEAYDDRVRVELTLNLTIGRSDAPGSILYAGDKRATMAENGDYSFARRVPTEYQDASRVFIGRPDEPGGDSVEFLGPMEIRWQEIVEIDRSGRARGADGREFQWIMWIDPDRVPFGGTATYARWMAPNGTVLQNELLVEGAENSAALAEQLSEAGITRSNWIRSAGDLFTVQVGTGEARRVWSLQFQDIYEGEAGILLSTLAGCFVDDILTARLGLISFCGQGLQLLQTSVPLDETQQVKKTTGAGGFALAVLALVATAFRPGATR